jgi:hemerythrin-like domain-containing protein
VAGFLLGELDSHHGIEDHHYFPRLARIEPRLQRGFDLLDADHHALHEALDTLAGAANAVLRGLRGDGARDDAGRAADGLDALGRLLDRHLADEEDIVAPLLIAHGERGLG